MGRGQHLGAGVERVRGIGEEAANEVEKCLLEGSLWLTIVGDIGSCEELFDMPFLPALHIYRRV